MPHAGLSARLSVLSFLLFSLNAPGNDVYVAPNGSPSGSGTITEPYDLTTAFMGRVGRPGDTFWLRGGNYVIGRLDTKISSLPGQTVTFRPVPGEKARIDGSLTIFDSAGYIVFRDFELYSSDTNRLSAQTNVGFDPTDIQPVSGIACYSPNISFINLVVRDHTRHGFYIGESATNTLVYGCVVYNNGWAAPDNAEGHNFYIQGDFGTKGITDNVAFNCTGVNFHIYESNSGRRLTGITLDGNVAFNAGTLQTVRPYRDWVVGVDPPATSADRIVLRNNMGYSPPTSTAFEQVEIGRVGINGRVALLNNYLPQGLLMNNWSIATVAGNLFAARATNWIVSLNQMEVSLAAAWDNNSYMRAPTGRDFQRNLHPYDFSEWQQATWYDGNSTYMVGNLTGTEIFVRPNRYEAGRAHIIVYNWDNLEDVTVDVSSVLSSGAAYEVRNVQDLSAPPVLSGVYHGEPLRLPMTGLSVAAPNGPLLTPPPTGPTFNVFILIPCQTRLGIARVSNTVEFFWPTNCGHYVLQSSDSASGINGWTDVEIEPAVRADQYVVTNLMTATARFYRLRSQ